MAPLPPAVILIPRTSKYYFIGNNFVDEINLRILRCGDYWYFGLFMWAQMQTKSI